MDLLLRRWTWSEGHIDHVCREVSAFLATHPVVIEHADVAQGNRTFVARVVRSVPDRIPLLIGDALQALRSPLDNLAWALASSHVLTPSNNVRFPVAETQHAWASFAGTVANDFAPVHLAALEQVQPYGLQDPQTSPLWQLHRLAIQDRHRTLVLGFHAATVATFTAWGPAGNKPNPNLVLGMVTDGQQVGDWPMAGDWQELGFPPISFEFDLAFDLLGAAGGRPICSTLLGLSNAVRTILDEFAQFFP